MLIKPKLQEADYGKVYPAAHYRTGYLSSREEFELYVRKNAKSFTVVVFTPGKNARARAVFDKVEDAREWAKHMSTYDGVRCAMVYAVAENERFVLMYTANQSVLREVRI